MVLIDIRPLAFYCFYRFA